MIAKIMLNRLGYQIDIANNGLEAIEAIKNKTYNLVLMDVQMPEMNGITATILIRTTLASPINEVQIIAMTADVMPEDLQACLDAGMNGYISKPINLQEIIKLVSNFNS